MATVTRSNVDASARRVLNSLARQGSADLLKLILGHALKDKNDRTTAPQRNAVQAMLEELFEIWLVQNDSRFGANDDLVENDITFHLRPKCVAGIAAAADSFGWTEADELDMRRGGQSAGGYSPTGVHGATHPKAHTINEGA